MSNNVPDWYVSWKWMQDKRKDEQQKKKESTKEQIQRQIAEANQQTTPQHILGKIRNPERRKRLGEGGFY